MVLPAGTRTNCADHRLPFVTVDHRPAEPNFRLFHPACGGKQPAVGGSQRAFDFEQVIRQRLVADCVNFLGHPTHTLDKIVEARRDTRELRLSVLHGSESSRQTWRKKMPTPPRGRRRGVTGRRIPDVDAIPGGGTWYEAT